ncbi:MAG: GNAT family N-acetyltransferase [Bacteroidota bacterium]
MLSFQCLSFPELTLDQLYALLALRQNVFVVEQDCPYLDADGKDQAAWHLLGYEGEQLVAYTRLLPKGISYSKYAAIGRVVTDQSTRGKGYGRLLMQESIKQCQLLFGESPIKISAQTYLLDFYTSLGFQAVGEPYLEDGIPHVGMEMGWELGSLGV